MPDAFDFVSNVDDASVLLKKRILTPRRSVGSAENTCDNSYIYAKNSKVCIVIVCYVYSAFKWKH